jgi:hypothetical protein
VSGGTPPDDTPDIAVALGRRAVAGTRSAALALLVIVMAIASGSWLALRLLDAGALLVNTITWPAALQALAALAGLAAVADIVMAWRERAARPRRELRWIGVLALVAAVVFAVTARPELDTLRSRVLGHAILRTDWWPAIATGLVAACALLLAIRSPAPPPPLPSREAFAQAAAAGIAGAVSVAEAAVHLSADVARRSSDLARDGTDALERQGLSLAARLHAALVERGAGPGLFLLMLLPVLAVIVPLAIWLLEYGGMSIMMLAGILLLPLMALYVAALAGLLRLWWALLAFGRPAPGWACLFTALGIPLFVAVAWAMRGSPDHYAFALELVVGGVPITPPMVAAADGVVLLALHAVPRRAPASERLFWLLLGVALAACVLGAVLSAT